MPLRTGYENVVAHLVDEGFAYVAKQDGKVIEKTNEYITVLYHDGTTESIEYGKQYKKSKGSIYQHILECDYEVDQTFKEGHVLIFNRNFFIRDILNPGQVLMTTYTLARTALVDFQETWEDGCAVSERFSLVATTPTIHTKSIVIEAGATINDVLKPGTRVNHDDVLCTIEDQVYDTNEVFGETGSDVLKRLGAFAPRAGHQGTIERIEVIYCCDIEEMSESMKRVVLPLDQQRKRLLNKTKKGTSPDNRIEEPSMINGNMVNKGSVMITFYIRDEDNMSNGDKAVIANQLKCTVTRVLTGKNETESGRPIDVWFGYQSIANRIVHSPELIGTTNTLMRHITMKALEAYDS